MCSFRRDGAQGRALEMSNNYNIGGGKVAHERDGYVATKEGEKQKKVMSQKQGKRIVQKEGGVNSVGCYQEVMKRPEKKCLGIFNNQVVV